MSVGWESTGIRLRRTDYYVYRSMKVMKRLIFVRALKFYDDDVENIWRETRLCRRVSRNLRFRTKKNRINTMK